MKLFVGLYAVIGTICFFLYLAGNAWLVQHVQEGSIAFALVMAAPVGLSAAAVLASVKHLVDLVSSTRDR